MLKEALWGFFTPDSYFEDDGGILERIVIESQVPNFCSVTDLISCNLSVHGDRRSSLHIRSPSRTPEVLKDTGWVEGRRVVFSWDCLTGV